MEEKSFGNIKPFIRKSPRKWDVKDIRIKLDNLKKLLGSNRVDSEIAFQMTHTDNEMDYLNMAYYALKARYCKINRRKYGVINLVEYTPRKKNWDVYSSSNNWDDYTWTVTTANTSTSATYFYSLHAR